MTVNDDEFVAIVRTGNKSGAGFHGDCVSCGNEQRTKADGDGEEGFVTCVI